MSTTTVAYRVDLEPRLVEESVLLAVNSIPREDRRRFRRERDLIYELQDDEERESRFRDLHSRWFVLLELPALIYVMLGEQPLLARGTSRCLVLPAVTVQEEGADLHENRQGGPGTSEAGPVLVIRLRPGTLLEPERLMTLLRHELYHAADMVDPSFGYTRSVPSMDAGPAYENLVRDRYRILWNTTIDGRLASRGHLSAEGVERSRRAFLAAFAMLGEAAHEHFRRLFEGGRPRHEELWSFATRPGGEGTEAVPGRPIMRSRPGRCPLCRFPTTAFQMDPECMPGDVLAEIGGDFPSWSPAQGLCVQCAGLYEARMNSAANVAS